MKANRQTEDAAAEPPNSAKLLANFLALRQQFQGLEAENVELNLKKTQKKKSRRWSTKRLLVPPAARAKSVRHVGAPSGNTNRLKHGGYTRERLLFYAIIRTHIQESRALVAWATGEFGDKNARVIGD